MWICPIPLISFSTGKHRSKHQNSLLKRWQRQIEKLVVYGKLCFLFSGLCVDSRTEVELFENILAAWSSYTFVFQSRLNRSCLVYIFSLRLSGSKFLINLRRQFRVRKIFVHKFLWDLHFVFSFCV